MIDANLLQQLDSPHPERRKRAIAELAKTRDPAALPYLATLYRADTDSEVRELARKAGVYINKHNGISESKPRSTISTDTYAAYNARATSTYAEYDGDDAEEEDISGIDSAVSAVDRERALGFVQQALDMHMKGKPNHAVKYMRQAFQKNPNLTRDGYTRGIVKIITGYPPDVGIERIQKGGNAVKGDVKKSHHKANDDEPGAVDALIDMGIHLLIMLGINLAIWAFLYFYALDPLTEMIRNSASRTISAEQSFELQQLFAQFRARTFVGNLQFYLEGVLVTTGYQILIWFFVNIAAQMFLSGDGSFPRLIRKTAIPYALINSIGVGLWLAAAFYLIFDPESVGMIALLTLLFFAGMLMWTAKLLGDAYRFGTGHGCLTILISMFIFLMASCVVSAAAQFFALNAFIYGGF